MKQSGSESTKVNKAVFLVIILIMASFLVYSMREFFTAFLASIMFYVLFKPWMEFLVNKRKWHKSRAALLIVLVSLIIIILPMVGFVSLLFNKLMALATHPQLIKEYIAQVQTNLNVQLLTDENMLQLQKMLASFTTNVFNMGLSLFSSIAMMSFLMYFLLISFNRLEAAIILYLPFEKQKILRFGQELKSQTFSNAIGIPLIAIVQGFLSFFAYFIAGVPEPAFWGILTGFASIIPIVGTGIIWIPVCIYLFAQGNNVEGFGVLIWSAAVMGSSDNVIRFILAKRMADVHPVVTVLGVIMGLNYMGIPGLIFGPLLISYFLILLGIYYSTYRYSTKKENDKESVLEVGLPFVYQKKFFQKKNTDE